jgi:hypothetical protein
MAITSKQTDNSIVGTYMGPVDPFDPFNGQQLTIQGISGYPTIGAYDPQEFVKGEMITAQMKVTDLEITQMNIDEDQFKHEMKKKLAHELAEQLLRNKFVEFTKQENLHTGETIFRARAFLTPDDKVRILRKEIK